VIELLCVPPHHLAIRFSNRLGWSASSESDDFCVAIPANKLHGFFDRQQALKRLSRHGTGHYIASNDDVVDVGFRYLF
jgi:hypothetical protein